MPLGVRVTVDEAVDITELDHVTDCNGDLVADIDADHVTDCNGDLVADIDTSDVYVALRDGQRDRELLMQTALNDASSEHARHCDDASHTRGSVPSSLQ